MKIAAQEMFLAYSTRLNNEIIANKETIENFKKSREFILNQLSNYKHYFDTFTNIDFSCFETIKKPINSNRIIMYNHIGLDKRRITQLINMLCVINSNIEKYEKKVKVCIESKISDKIFKQVIYKFNAKISDEILDKGYTFAPGYGIKIRIKKVDCRNLVLRNIDWNSSLKKKAEIIAKGGLPYKTLKYDKNDKPIEGNGGEDWFVRFTTPFDYIWFWQKVICKIPNNAYYKFKPTIYNNVSRGENRLGNINKLKLMIRENDEKLKNFY